MPASPDAVALAISQAYPQSTSTNALGVRFGVTAAVLQPVLDGLARQLRILCTAPGAPNPTYLDAIERTRLFLVQNPGGVTPSQAASALRITPSVVQAQLDRLVILSYATKTIGTPENTYRPTSLAPHPSKSS